MIALAILPHPRDFVMPRTLDQSAILDCDGWALRSPTGVRPPRRLRRHLFVLLEALTRHPGVVVEYDVLIEALWPDAYKPVEPRNSVWVYVCTLRDLLEAQGWPREMLVTRPGIGLQIDRALAQWALDAANGVWFD